jgi:hypothetical protein
MRGFYPHATHRPLPSQGSLALDRGEHLVGAVLGEPEAQPVTEWLAPD